MLDEYRNIHPIAYKIIKNSINKGKISHAYLIEANGYNKKLDFAISLAKFLLCPAHKSELTNCPNCNLCERINHGNFTELKIIEPDGLWIKKEQLEQLQEEFSKKSIESEYRIYIVNGAEKLNSSAANSILKFLEEPEPGIIAILISDNIYQTLETIVSRCQIISLNKVKNNYENSNCLSDIKSTKFQIAKKYAKNEEDLSFLLQDDMFNEQINAAVNFAHCYETTHYNVLTELPRIWNPYFNDKEKMIMGIEFLIMYYKDLLNFKLRRNVQIFQNEIDNFLLYMESNTEQGICKKIKILMKMKDRIKFNANIQLLMDKLVLELEEVKYDKSYQSYF